MKINVEQNANYPEADHINLYVTVELNQSANVRVLFESAVGEQLRSKNVVLVGDDYEAWGEDDNYVKDYILTAYGLTEREVVQDGY